MRLKDLNPNSKIQLGVLLIVLIVLLQGGFALVQMNKLSQLTDDMYNHPLAVSKTLKEIESHIHAMHRAIKDVAVSETPESLETALAVLRSHEQHIQQDFSLISEKYLGDRKHIDHAYGLLQAYKFIQDEVIVLSKAGSNQAALQFITDKGASQINRIIAALDPMIDFADNKAIQFLKESQAQQTTSVIMLIFSMLLFSGSVYFVFLWTIKTYKSSERKYTKLIHNMREGVTIGSAEGILLYVNPSFASMLGYAHPRELIDTPVIDLYANPQEREAIFERIRVQGFIDNMEIGLIKKDGSLIHVLVSINAKRDEAGHIIEIESLVSDITDRKQAEKVILTEKLFSESMIHGLPGVFYLISEEGKFLRWNTNFEKVTGRSAEEMLKISPVDLFDGEDKQVIATAIKRVFTHGEDQAEGRFVAKGGQRTPYRFSGKKIIVDGAPCLVGLGMDMTESKQAEIEKENALLEAKKANEVKDQFIANISHEIRTPLNSILGFSDLFKQRYSDAIQEKDKIIFDYITDSSDRLMHTVDSILHMSMLKSGAISVHKEVVNLNQMTATMVNNFRFLATKKHLSMELIDSGLVAEVFVDKNCISSAIGNLTDNAIKYTEEGGISLVLDVIEDQVILSISDTGIGISEENQQRVFEPYTQESEGFTKVYQGVGLGLAITKQFLDLNDVSLDLESQKNVGTTFKLTFPIVKAEDVV
ncbi:MAG: PAS domain S-box protein [Candidatus Marinimicrobia bacterium]|nr:PAS domain S-box protein [FCB group bacterium]MBL7024886.1 PAS domain S-box protein [Candidatus Neomarinimicrobiota bacterium]